MLSRIPALRLLVPLAAGILIHRIWHNLWAPIVLILVAVACYLLMLARSRTPQGRLCWRPYFIVPIAVCAIAAGWLTAVVHCPPQLTKEQRTRQMLTGRVTDLSYTDFSMRLTVEVTDPAFPQCRVLVTTRGCDYTMRTGDLVNWPADLEEVTDAGNPDEIDYAAYLLDTHGIRYTQHLPLKDVVKIGYSPTLLTRLSSVRRELRLMVFGSYLSSGAQRFVAALLLGDSGMIDKSTRQEFAAAGIAHVLALSGLHVGIIALLIWWLLFPLDYIGLKKVRLVITLAAITLFAVFTGLSASVVRATVMIGMVFASLIFHRRSVSLNALAIVALAILVFSPSALFTVGFQLSFITVAALLLFARLPEPLQSRHKWVNGITSAAFTSLVAMLATMALTAHYFHTVSLLSVLSYLLILPALPVFMILGALFLAVTAAGMSCGLLNACIDAVYRYIHWVAGTVSAIPLSHVGGVYVSSFGVVAYFVIIAFIALWLYRRQPRYLLAAGGALAVLLAHSIWIDSRTPRRGLIVFNDYTATPVLYYDHGCGYVWTPDDEETDSATFARHYSGFLARHNIDDLVIVRNDTVTRLKDAVFRPPYAHLAGQRLLAVSSGRRRQTSTSGKLRVDDIIVTKRYNGNADRLRDHYGFDRLIVSGAMQRANATALERECDSLGIENHILSKDGAKIF